MPCWNEPKSMGLLRHCTVYTVSQKNDTDVSYYNLNAHQPILVIFGRDVAKKARYRMVICYSTYHH